MRAGTGAARFATTRVPAKCSATIKPSAIAWPGSHRGDRLTIWRSAQRITLPTYRCAQGILNRDDRRQMGKVLLALLIFVCVTRIVDVASHATDPSTRPGAPRHLSISSAVDGFLTHPQLVWFCHANQVNLATFGSRAAKRAWFDAQGPGVFEGGYTNADVYAELTSRCGSEISVTSRPAAARRTGNGGKYFRD